MTQHPVEGTLQAYLDGEIQSEPREAMERHLEACRECRALLASLDDLANRTARALRVVDREPPAMEAARWEARRARAAHRSRSHGRRVAVAASIVLLLGAGWVAAMPGSPIRRLWEGDAVTQDRIETLGPSVEDSLDQGRTAVSVQLEEGRATVSIEAAPSTWIDVRLSEIEGVRVSAPAGSRFETGSGRIQIDVGGLEGDVIVELSRDAVLADVFVRGRLVYQKSGVEASYLGGTEAETRDGSIRFPAGGGP